MSADSQQQYNALPSEGRQYVDQQMEKYDEYCAQADDC